MDDLVISYDDRHWTFDAVKLPVALIVGGIGTAVFLIGAGVFT